MQPIPIFLRRTFGYTLGIGAAPEEYGRERRYAEAMEREEASFVAFVPFFVSMSSEEGKGEHAWKRLDLCGD